MIQEIYKNNQLVNVFTSKCDNFKSLVQLIYLKQFKNKTYTIKEKYNYTNKMDFIITWTDESVDGQRIKWKYIYKDFPCTCNNLDINKCQQIIVNDMLTAEKYQRLVNHFKECFEMRNDVIKLSNIIPNFFDGQKDSFDMLQDAYNDAVVYFKHYNKGNE